jgi:hypothetical protein
MKVAMPNETESQSVLCYLTDWQERPSEGPKSKTDTLRFRFGISVSPNQWMLTEFRDALALHRTYASNFSDLTPTFKTIAGIRAFDGIKKVQEALEAVAKINPNLKPLPTKDDIELALDFANQVDSFYQTDFAIHDNVRERYFGAGGEEDDE